MKLLVVCIALCLALVVADTDLPPNFSSANDLASVLANEPAAANARFAETASTDVITFRDDSNSPGCSGGSCSQGEAPSSSNSEEDDGEFDSQIGQVEEDIKRLKEQIKDSEECARRLTEQKGELDSLVEQREHLQKEKEKTILQKKMDKQMRDLAEINKMSKYLRQKFGELKHTQQLIKSRLTGTRSSLKELDSDSEINMSDIKDAPDAIGSEVDAMQKAQSAILKHTHEMNSKQVRDTIKLDDKINLEQRARSEKHNN